MSMIKSVQELREILEDCRKDYQHRLSIASIKKLRTTIAELEQAYQALDNADATVKNLMQDLGIQCLPCQLPRFTKEKFASLLADLENVRQESRQYKEAMIRAEALYMELLLQVGNVYPGETRHQTALRYLRQAEQSNGGPSCESSH